jgi:hypothetical protein
MVHPAYKIGLAVVAVGLLGPLAAQTFLSGNTSGLFLLGGQKDKPRQVQDEAKLFTEKAIEEANSLIAKIKETHQKDLLIETKEKGPAAKAAAKWAFERATTLGVEGIYIIITTEPRHFEVYVTEKTRKSGLITIGDRDEIVALLKGNLGKNKDDALLKVVNYTQDTFNKRAIKPAGDFQLLIGEWLGPPVEVAVKTDKTAEIKEGMAKGNLYLRFSDVRGKPCLDLGYNVRTLENISLSVARNYSFDLKQNGKERTIVVPYAKKDVVLTYEWAEDTLKIKASGTLPIPDVAEPVDLSGEWKRLSPKR